jgi:hypothetical protein
MQVSRGVDFGLDGETGDEVAFAYHTTLLLSGGDGGGKYSGLTALVMQDEEMMETRVTGVWPFRALLCMYVHTTSTV